MKPRQYACVIKKCTIHGCDTWFIGTSRSRYCDFHKKTQAARIINGKHLGKPSRFSLEEVTEMRDLFHKMTVKEIAAHFNCKPSLIYRYVHRDPIRYREIEYDT